MTIAEVKQLKGQRKLVCMTAYDYELARILERAGPDILLVGDTGAKYSLGGDDITATMDEMVLMTRSVRRASQRAIVVGDMPFMSYQISIEAAIANAGRFLKEAKADAVKLEGGEEIAPTIAAITRAGIPVMGHMGFTPMMALAVGGDFRSEHATVSVEQIRRDAFALQEAGVFSMILTRVPPTLATELTKELRIPTLAGGGSGDDCDGVVCVTHNAFGMRVDEIDNPRAQYGPLAVPIYETAKKYCDDVRSGKLVRGGVAAKVR